MSDATPPPDQSPGETASGPPPYGQSPYEQSPYGQPPSGGPPYGQPPWGSPAAGAPGDAGRRDGAIALTCGIIGLLVLSIVLGPVAIFFGNRGRRSGSGTATAGFVLGIIDVVLFVLYLGVIGARRAFL
jgi:hypothetical protein